MNIIEIKCFKNNFAKAKTKNIFIKLQTHLKLSNFCLHLNKFNKLDIVDYGWRMILSWYVLLSLLYTYILFLELYVVDGINVNLSIKELSLKFLVFLGKVIIVLINLFL